MISARCLPGRINFPNRQYNQNKEQLSQFAPGNGAMETKVCEHLQPILSRLLKGGSRVLAMDTGWSAVDFNIVLDKGPSLEALRALLGKCDSFLKTHENKDLHYALDISIVCQQHRQGISWPSHVNPGQ